MGQTNKYIAAQLKLYMFNYLVKYMRIEAPKHIIIKTYCLSVW